MKTCFLVFLNFEDSAFPSLLVSFDHNSEHQNVLVRISLYRSFSNVIMAVMLLDQSFKIYVQMGPAFSSWNQDYRWSREWKLFIWEPAVWSKQLPNFEDLLVKNYYLSGCLRIVIKGVRKEFLRSKVTYAGSCSGMYKMSYRSFMPWDAMQRTPWDATPACHKLQSMHARRCNRMKPSFAVVCLTRATMSGLVYAALGWTPLTMIQAMQTVLMSL